MKMISVRAEGFKQKASDYVYSAFIIILIDRLSPGLRWYSIISERLYCYFSDDEIDMAASLRAASSHRCLIT